MARPDVRRAEQARHRHVCPSERDVHGELHRRDVPPRQSGERVFIAQDFGRLYDSSNALSATVSGTKVNSGTVNSFNGNPRIAQDAANPNRLWFADHESGGGGCGTLCLQASTDGGNNASPVKFPNDSNVTGGLYDVSSQGGVEVTAGSGGENGALAITAAANTIPDIIAPTGTISGPTTVTSGRATRYTAVVADNAGGSGINPNGYTWIAPGQPAQHGATATYTFPRGVGEVTLTVTFTDNAGDTGTATLTVHVKNAAPPGPPTGSKPATTHTGQATIKIYRIVTVTGRNARLVPVIVSATQPRRFTVQILPLKGKKALATGRLTLKGRHGGNGTIRVRLPARVKPWSAWRSSTASRSGDWSSSDSR